MQQWLVMSELWIRKPGTLRFVGRAAVQLVALYQETVADDRRRTFDSSIRNPVFIADLVLLVALKRSCFISLPLIALLAECRASLAHFDRFQVRLLAWCGGRPFSSGRSAGRRCRGFDPKLPESSRSPQQGPSACYFPHRIVLNLSLMVRSIC